jgi:hypothetical protein
MADALKKLSDDLHSASSRMLDIGLIECPEMKQGKPSCIQQERARPLSTREINRGWQQRPFDGYDDSRMCAGCAAYWHSTRAEQCLRKYVKATQHREPIPARMGA